MSVAAKQKPESHAFRVSTDPVRHEFRQQRAAAMESQLASRRQLAPQLSDLALSRMPRDEGYAMVPPGVLDTKPVVDWARAVLERVDVRQKREDTKKPFLVKLGEKEDLTLESPPFRLALRPELIGAATSYLGMVPILEYVNVFFSSHAAAEPAKSQLYHCDSDELEQVKVFVLCETVTPESGPLTFLPARHSEIVRHRLGYKYNTRLTDEQVSAALGGTLDGEVQLLGPPGTTAFIDTSRCLHYGSRFIDASAHRLVVMLQYVTPLAFLYPGDYREHARFRRLAQPGLDEIATLVLGAA